MVIIKVDNEKCPNAFDCLKCINTCQSGALLVLPYDNPYVLNGKGRIEPAIMSLCTACGDCQRNCPTGAISLSCSN